MRRLSVLLVVTMMLPLQTARSQQQQGEKTPQVSAAVRTEVLAFVRGYIDAENRADATSLSDAMSRRTDVTSVNTGTITRGWEAIRASTDQITGKQGIFREDVGTMDVVSLGTGYVLIVAPMTITLNAQQGQRQFPGAMTLVLEKSQDGWKILNEHYSLKAP
ncbi:MAG TPA: nuclear transport factor 2 family protein [Gemmatimonadaceae bacterium]